MRKSIVLAGCLAFTASTVGCAGTGGIGLGADRGTCIAVAGTIGGIAGLVIANQGEGETDERLGVGGLGTAAGAALGSLVCGEGGRVAIQTAQIRANPRSGETPLDVALIADVSPVDAGARYEWDFGDGSRGEGARVQHTYRSAESFDVRLTVTDARGRTSVANTRIDARNPAPPQVSAQPPVEQPRRRIVLRGVGFEFDSSTLSARELEVLGVAVEELRANPELRVRIVGHTDSKGTDEYNQKLSQRRAQAVLGFLTRRGIERRRLEAVGLGEENPVATNDTEDGRAQNRRVELDMID
jgi:OmpA-OmpF porin, OOP family